MQSHDSTDNSADDNADDSADDSTDDADKGSMLLDWPEGRSCTLLDAPPRVLEQSRLSPPSAWEAQEHRKPRNCGAGRASSPLPWLHVCTLARLILAQEGEIQIEFPFCELDQPASLATKICVQHQDAITVEKLMDEECARSLLPFLQERARARTHSERFKKIRSPFFTFG